MEVLGAVASSIAVVQALATGKHVVSIIREVPGIQDDFNYLMKECISSSVLKLEYQIPRWLFFRSFIIAASYNNICGLRCSLRPFRLIDVTSAVWNWKTGSSQVIRRSVFKYGVYPGDTDIRGCGLIEYALGMNKYNALEALLDLWGNVLFDIELPRRAVHHANRMLLRKGLRDHQIYLLQRLIRLSGGESGDITTKIHIAIRRREGLQAALQEQPWAINTIDYTGHCPLTLATDRNQIGRIMRLISAGADVNQVTTDGKSALMLAAPKGAPESVRLLLNARCSVDLVDIHGCTALHRASTAHCVESVSLLIAAGASVTRRDYSGKTPLHYLTRYDKENRDDTKRIVELLVLAGADLEARDIFGVTPVISTLHYDNISAMECLLDFGCSLSYPDSMNHNILHTVAMYASLEMLEYLGSLDLDDINPYQNDSRGRTPGHLILRAYDQKLAGIRTISTAELSAFLNLCQGIKDRSLQHDIDNIEQVVAGLRDRDVATTRKHLGPLLAKEERWKREGLVCWYRAVDKRIHNMEWDLAIEDLSDYLTELKEEVGTPVYDIPLRYGCKFSDSQTWEITTCESESWKTEASESEASESDTSE